MAKARTKSEKLFDEIADILKKRLSEMKAREIIEYGFYTTEGMILFFALDEVMHIDALNSHPDYRNEHLTEYFLSLTRESVIKLFEAMVLLGDWPIPVVQVRPFEPLKWMANPVYGVTKVWHTKYPFKWTPDGPNETVVFWKSVPVAIRALIAVSIPSLQFIFIEILRDILEVG